jgi:acetolactate synthase-1/2/3 large subunit
MTKVVSDIIIEFLINNNIDVIFTLSGGFIGPILNSISKYNKIKLYCFNHEQAAAMAADGYARVSKKPCCLLITNGPGASNTVTGVIGAFQDSIPIFVISGQVPYQQSLNSQQLSLRQLGVQELNIISVVSSFTKYSYLIKDKNEVISSLYKAYNECISDRMGPVWLDIPLDVQNSFIDISDYSEFTNTLKQSFDISTIDYNFIVNKINNSKRPLFLIGNGIKLSNTENIFNEIITKLKIPLVSSWLGKDIVNNDDPLFCGVIGILGERFSNLAIQKCDLLIVLGCRLNITQIGYDFDNFSKNSYKIMIDVDNNELEKKTIKIDTKINCDLSIFLNKLNNIISNSKLIKTDFSLWINTINSWKLKYSTIDLNINNLKMEGEVNSYFFSKYLAKIIKNDTVIVTDTGSSSFSIFQSLHLINSKIFTAAGQASMGYGLPASIGAYIANNSNNIVLVVGDGGFQLNIQELQTIINYKIPIKIFILNNSGYLAIKIMQQNLFKSNYVASTSETGVRPPDFIKISEAYGIRAFSMKTNNDVERVINEMFSYEGSCLCEINMIENQLITPRVQSVGNNKSLEYMFPFIDENELNNLDF